MPTHPPPMPAGSGRKLPAPPKHLESTERNLWKTIVSEFDFSDASSLALLRTAMESHQRARRCREAVDHDGEAVLDRWKQLKPHPLLTAERDARAAFIQSMRALNLDLGIQR